MSGKIPGADPPVRIRIGALLDGAREPVVAIRKLLGLGFESFQLSFWQSTGDTDLKALAASVGEALDGSPATLSAIGVYGNPLGDDESGRETLRSLGSLLEAAPDFRAQVVSCFAGRAPGKSVPDSVPEWVRIFTPLAERAAKRGVVIGLENCRLGDTWKTGKWNIAINPDAWELLFRALPGAPIGLEWEPAHQILSLADPLVQLEAWASRVVHVHGKDATVDRAAVGLRGIHGARRIGQECLAGYGDTDWYAAFGILFRAGYRGSVDIELGSDTGYRGEREAEGLELAFLRLKSARESSPAR